MISLIKEDSDVFNYKDTEEKGADTTALFHSGIVTEIMERNACIQANRLPKISYVSGTVCV